MNEKRHNDAIDIFKGIIVILMVLTHCIQFFGTEEELLQGIFVNFVNLIAFPGFMFAYGFVCYLAYFSKEFSTVWGKMLQNAGKTLLAFYASSIAYGAFVGKKAFSTDFLRDVILVSRFEGWSEFLVSFTSVIVLGILLFPLLKRTNIITVILFGAISIGACFIPYERVVIPQLALFLGSTRYITFPVVQYMFYFISGVFISRKNLKFHKLVLIITGILSLPVIVYVLNERRMPSRFPPSWIYLLGAFLFLYLIYLFSNWAIFSAYKNRVVSAITGYVKAIGSNSLLYLLISNVLIFGFAGSSFYYKGFSFAFVFFVLLLLFIYYLINIVRKTLNYQNNMGGVT